MAEVNNSMAITISSSEDALIAMPEETELDITKEITTIRTLIDKEPNSSSNNGGEENSREGLLLAQESSYEVNTETSISINYNNDNDFYIRNNMNDHVDIDIYISDKSIKANPSSIMHLNPGESQKVKLFAGSDVESQSIDVAIYATWDAGSAEIYKTINVNVETINTEKTIDLRKPREIPIPVASVVNEENKSSFEDGLKQEEMSQEVTQLVEENIEQDIQQPVEIEQETETIVQETSQLTEEMIDETQYEIIIDNDIEDPKEPGTVTIENEVIDTTSDLTEQDNFKGDLDEVSPGEVKKNNEQLSEEKEVIDDTQEREELKDDKNDDYIEKNNETPDEVEEEYTQESMIDKEQ